FATTKLLQPRPWRSRSEVDNFACGKPMRAIVCLVFCGCSGADCPTLGLRYAAAFEDAQQCTPGVDTCSYAAESPWEDLPDGGRTLEISTCTCGSGNLNPRKVGPLMTAIHEYRAHGCQQVMGCTCGTTEPPPYSCRATLDGGMC